MAVEIAKVECVEVGGQWQYGKLCGRTARARLWPHAGQLPAPCAAILSARSVAVSAVHIEGVQHEFSTVPGVKEDVTEIILNLKGLAVKDVLRRPQVCNRST